jgi:hypothetical protein
LVHNYLGIADKIPPSLPFPKGGIPPLKRGVRGDFWNKRFSNYGFLSKFVDRDFACECEMNSIKEFLDEHHKYLHMNPAKAGIRETAWIPGQARNDRP